MVSAIEKNFVLQGVEVNHRIDGRSTCQRRTFTVKPSFLPRTIGSCRITQENGNDVIVGLRLETNNSGIDNLSSTPIHNTDESNSYLGVNPLLEDVYDNGSGNEKGTDRFTFTMDW